MAGKKPVKAVTTTGEQRRPKVKPVVTKAKQVMPAGPQFYNQAGKPDPKGHYDRDGYMVRVPGKANSSAKTVKMNDTEAAKKAGYAK